MAAAFRLFSELETFYGQSGQLLAGGYLKFYTAGTTTPKDVFGEEALSTNNGSTIDLDSSGRPEHDIWGSGSYFVELFDADDVKQGEADDVQIPGGEATALPALSADKFLTNDGSVMSWATIREVPDPSGSANKILGTDGTDLIWVDQTEAPEVVEPDIVVGATSFQAGTSADETKFLIQTGTGTCPISATRTSSVNITFPTAFSTILAVIPMASTSSVGTFGIGATMTAAGFTVGSPSSGATITANSADDGGDSGYTIANAVSFTWVAFGTVEVSAD